MIPEHLKTAHPRPRVRRRFLSANDTTCRRTNSTLHGGWLHYSHDTNIVWLQNRLTVSGASCKRWIMLSHYGFSQFYVPTATRRHTNVSVNKNVFWSWPTPQGTNYSSTLCLIKSRKLVKTGPSSTRCSCLCNSFIKLQKCQLQCDEIAPKYNVF